MMEQLVHLIIVIAVLIVAWLVIARFSPDALITKICQIIIFIIALIIVLTMVLPMAGVHF